MLGKIAIFLILAIVIYFVLKNKSNKKLHNKNTTDELIKCNRCNTFVVNDELKNGICSTCRSKK